MASILNHLLSSFEFTRHTDVVAAACIAIFFGSLLLGMVSALAKAFGGPLKPIPFTKTASFRLMLIAEGAVVIAVIYYHVALSVRVEPLQMVFWATTMAAMPVLWFLGSQITQVVFWSKIRKNRQAYLKKVRDAKFRKQKAMREQIRKDTRTSATAIKQRDTITAKGNKGMRQVHRRRKPV